MKSGSTKIKNQILLILIIFDFYFVITNLLFNFGHTSYLPFLFGKDSISSIVFHHLEIYCIILLLTILAISKKQVFYLCWAILFSSSLLDIPIKTYDLILNHLIARFLNHQEPILSQQGLYELGVTLSSYFGLLIFVTTSYLKTHKPIKKISLGLVILALSLTSFSLYAHIIHLYLPWTKLVFPTIADGGRMLITTIFALYFLFNTQIIITPTINGTDPDSCPLIGSNPSPKVNLVKNTFFNIAGRLIPLIITFVTIPPLIQQLGKDSFAILSLALVIIVFLSMFDLGLGKTLTKFIAEALSNNNSNDMPKYIWNSFWVQLSLGLMGSLFFAGFIPYIVNNILKIPSELVVQTELSFYILAISFPFVLLSGLFRGVLAGAEHFYIINLIQIPSTSAMNLLMLLGVYIGLNLPDIFIILTSSLIITCGFYVYFSFKLLPVIHQKVYPSASTLKCLFKFGSWLTISSIISPLLIYSERLMIGAILTMTALTYYTVPHEIIMRIWILPFGLMGVLFPAFSRMNASGNSQSIINVFGGSIKFLMLIVGPVVLVLFVFSNDILELWINPDFASHSNVVFRILLIGVLFSTLAQLPYTFFQSIGSPNITCFIQLSLVPVTLIMSYLFIIELGVVGAAISWSLTRLLAMIIGFTVFLRFERLDISFFSKNRLFYTAGLLLAFTITVLPLLLENDIILLYKILYTTFSLLIFVSASWFFICDDNDRSALSFYHK